MASRASSVGSRSRAASRSSARSSARHRPGWLGPMTHAIVVGDTLYDKAAGLYALVAAHDGCVLFVGGGQIVSDEIQTAKNLRLDHLLYAVVGASARHAAEYGQGFRSADEALSFLAQHRRGAAAGGAVRSIHSGSSAPTRPSMSSRIAARRSCSSFAMPTRRPRRGSGRCPAASSRARWRVVHGGRPRRRRATRACASFAKRPRSSSRRRHRPALAQCRPLRYAMFDAVSLTTRVMIVGSVPS